MRIKLKDITIWHKWFAWYPVIVDGHLVWLETVEREWYDWVEIWSYRFASS